MTTENESKYQRVVGALSELFADTSVSLDTSISNMSGIKDECDIYIHALEGDRKRQQESDEKD